MLRAELEPSMSDKPLHTRLPIVAAAAGIALVALAAGYAIFGDDEAGRSAPPPASGSEPLEEHARFKMPVSKTQPSLGPSDALVTVVEFCDLRGRACREADAAMRSALEAYGGKLRWVHRAHIPAKRRDAARRMHNFARAAFQHGGKFWEMRAKLLETPDGAELSEPDYARIAGELGLDYALMNDAIAQRQFEGAIAFDEVFAAKFGVRGEPAYFINGRPLQPAPDASLEASLREAIERELLVAERLVQQGVSPDAVYKELTKDGLWGVTERDELARKAARAEQR